MPDPGSNDIISERVIPEMSVPTSVCPHPERWHAYDNMATELEVLDFLMALVLMLKPDILIETGCYHGHATERMLRGMRANNHGLLFTCDVGATECEITRARLGVAPVSISQKSGQSLIDSLSEPVDFAFLDSGPDEIRTNELRALYPKLSPGGVVAIHDTGVQGFLREKYLPPLLRELDMQHIFFDTPRGLTLCRKRPEVYP